MYDEDALARAAYQAYGEETGGKNYRGEPMPAWDDLGDKIQSAWRRAVSAVVVRFVHGEPPDDEDPGVLP
jgi:hypothetical protein